MKTLKEKIEVMQAALDGADIEMVRITAPADEDEWNLTNNPVFDWNNFNYRIKPKPLEFWVNVYDSVVPYDSYETEKEAKDRAGRNNGIKLIKTIKAREITE